MLTHSVPSLPVNFSIRRLRCFCPGSVSAQAGFAGDDAPRTEFACVVGRPRGQRPGDAYSDPYVGDEAESKSGVLTLSYPIERGIVTNWDDMEKVWHHAFYNELRVAPEDRSVLLVEPLLNPKGNRERTARIMLETFNVPAVHFATGAVLSLFSAYRTTGLVVTCGDATSHVAGIVEGHVVPRSILQADFSGHDLTLLMAKLLQERGDYATAIGNERVGLLVACHIKETRGYVAVDFEEEMKVASLQPQGNDYELPDGSVIKLGSERFHCAEALFKPSLLGLPAVQQLKVLIAVMLARARYASTDATADGCTALATALAALPSRPLEMVADALARSRGLHELARDSIVECDLAVRTELFESVVLAGGTMMFSGIARRMERELSGLAPAGARVQVVEPTGYSTGRSAWVGGSILASLDSFPDSLVGSMYRQSTAP
jgi:actin